MRREIVAPCGGDAEPDAPHPGGDPRALAQEGQDAAEIAGERVRDVEEAEVGARWQRRQPIGARLGDATPALAFGLRRHELARNDAAAHPDVPRSWTSRATNGAILSAMISAPLALGWSPSGWFSVGSVATPSRKNG
jgi:hypothetical protein